MNEPAQEVTIDTKEEKTYYDIEQPGDVPVGEALEDLDLAVEVIEERRALPTPVHGLDHDLVASFLGSGISAGSYEDCKARRRRQDVYTHLMNSSVHRRETAFP